MLVHKSPSCGCCVHWVEHMREAGFTVEVRDVDNVQAVKDRVGVPTGKASCHTAEVGGYFIEGHVPAADVKRLLAEAPEARGLTVPGMPAGSPGMELPDGRVQPYAVELVANDGSTTEFSRHGE
ncbi:copper amine oxidase [Lysobacter arseniciresistens ZS79]|uniref:Copper amine oxidase n=1 Tax=Lysobacter arseniciresistens ZS79 TaxID=913325 RepID=A0A0A0F450_9GAMM|nr:copper amine oxidase [Lysobacter arseniciresistens ZS79]